jgi:hypothetical protein
VIRIRKLGFEPSVVKLNLVAGDDREVIIKMKRISAKLDPVVVTARSGYDSRDQQVWDDLEKRMRWKSFKNPILGPEDLKRFRGADLDLVVKGMLLSHSQTKGYPVNPNRPNQPAPSRLDSFGSDECILLNGKTPMKRPLRVFDTDQIDLLEIYPPYTEFTGTVGWYMERYGPCKPQNLLQHPTYYVIWMKGAK